MAQIKLVVTDLDGTLLRSDDTLGQFTINVFHELRQQGIKVCFASGRANQMMSIYKEPIIHCDYHISFNGAIVESIEDKRIVFKNYMNSYDAHNVFKYMLQNKRTFTMYTSEKMYYAKNEQKLIDRIERYEVLASRIGINYKLNAYGLNHESVLAESEFEKIAKIVLYEEDEGIRQELIDYISTLRETTFESTGYGLTGVFNSKVSKQNALRFLQKQLGVSRTETCVFGDYDNDVSLFNTADMKVAVSNATDCIKDLASHVTGSNDEEGVADFISSKIL